MQLLFMLMSVNSMGRVSKLIYKSHVSEMIITKTAASIMGIIKDCC